MLKVSVFSDYICPFCYIGKRRIEKLAEEVPVQPIWKGYEIHPETPAEGIDISTFLPEMISNLEARIRVLAEEAGIEMNMPERLPNSRLALFGGEYAREIHKLDEYHEAVFAAYFTGGMDIGDIDTLVSVATSISIDGDVFRKAIEDRRHWDALRATRRQAQSLGLAAVPSYVFDDENIIVGVQPFDAFRAAAERASRSGK